jgi:hypothetical protein
MIIWQGYGFLGALIPVVLLLVFDKTRSMAYETEIAILLSALCVWFAGKKLNTAPGKRLIDPETNQDVILKNKHTIFWMPLEWFSFVLIAMVVYMFIKETV